MNYNINNNIEDLLEIIYLTVRYEQSMCEYRGLNIRRKYRGLNIECKYRWLNIRRDNCVPSSVWDIIITNYRFTREFNGICQLPYKFDKKIIF